MYALVLALVLALLLAAPHVLPQRRLTPAAGIAVWTAVLMLRAVAAVAVAVTAVFFLPATDLFSALTHWCLHTALPVIVSHLGLDGHTIGDAAVVVPAMVVAVSGLSVGVGLWRGTRIASAWLRHSAVGPGPSSSVIVGGPEVVVATAGVRAPRVVVSAGALVHLDDEELAAGLAHEWGHVRHRHRLFSMFGEVCRGLSRFLPGSGSALARLNFHLERDADDYAVRRTGDPLALASAICKAAPAPAPLRELAHLAGGGAADRVRLLTDARRPSPAAASALAVVLTVAMVAATLGLAAASPAVAATGLEELQQAGVERGSDCD